MENPMNAAFPFTAKDNKLPVSGRIDSCKTVELTRLEFLRGLGVEEDPVRIVTQWWTHEGEMIAEKDEFLRERRQHEQDKKKLQGANGPNRDFDLITGMTWKDRAIQVEQEHARAEKERNEARDLCKKAQEAAFEANSKRSQYLDELLAVRTERDKLQEEVRLLTHRAQRAERDAWTNIEQARQLERKSDWLQGRLRRAVEAIEGQPRGQQWTQAAPNPDCGCVFWSNSAPFSSERRYIGTWEPGPLKNAFARHDCVICHGTGYKPKYGDVGKPAATTAKPAPLRLLVEVVPEKDEKHGYAAYSQIANGFSDLHVSLIDRQNGRVAANGSAMSVKELPAMPVLKELIAVYNLAAWRGHGNTGLPDPISLRASTVVDRGIRAVLEACGLEVAE